MVAWLQTAFSHPAALLALLVKLAGVSLWASLLSRRVPDRLTAWLHSWLAVQIVQTIVIMGLSAVVMLSRTALWAFLLVVLTSGVMAYIVRGVRFRMPSRRVLLVSAAIALPLILWAIRSMVLPDFSVDAQSYGSVRIALWMNYRTVFVHMPTIAINIFADEWNGELNGLLYGFAAGDIQGVMMGNVEILLVAALASIWTARRFGAGQVGSMFVGLLVATAPAFVGLAAVTKGDLLSCVGVIMAIGMLVRPTPRAVWLACVWFALAGGAKISVTLGAAIVMAVSIVMLVRQYGAKQAFKGAGPAAILSAILLARFIANQFVYGHPFIRVDAESANPSLVTLAENIAVIGERFIGFYPIHWEMGQSFSTSLATGFGVAGWLALIGVISGQYRPARQTLILVALSIVSIGVTAYLIPARVWGFRYFLPFVSVLFIAWLVAFMQVVSSLRARWRMPALGAVALLAYANFLACFVPGDLTSPGTFESSMDQAVGKRPIQVAMQEWPVWTDQVHPDDLGLDSTPKSVAILNELGATILMFAGSHAQNRIYLAKDAAGLLGLAREHHPDYVVYGKWPGGVSALFDVPGYRWIINAQNYMIAKRID